jgi:hypothetical protein
VSENKSLCSYPWRGACIYPTGLVKPCCYWLSANGQLNAKNSNTTNDARNSTEWNNIRNDMLAGKSIKGCEKCYEMESVGTHSGRLSSLHYLVPTDNKLAPLEDLEVSIGYLKMNSIFDWNDAKRRITLLASERNLNISAMLPDLQKVINDF